MQRVTKEWCGEYEENRPYPFAYICMVFANVHRICSGEAREGASSVGSGGDVADRSDPDARFIYPTYG